MAPVAPGREGWEAAGPLCGLGLQGCTSSVGQDSVSGAVREVAGVSPQSLGPGWAWELPPFILAPQWSSRG